ncbi:hypothetical protein PO124_25885 [Bacillus licheniformis]|nr:hypothetical protein [Bacillus licheniformis]
MTKEFEQTKGDDLLVFMDQSPSEALKRSSRLPLPSFVRQCGAGRMQGLFPLVRSGMSSRFGRGRAAEKAVLLLGDCRLQCSPAVSQSDRGGIGTFRYEKSRQIYCDKPHHDRTGAGFEETALRRAARHLFGEEKGGDLSSEESAAVQHLKARGIEVNVIYGEHFPGVWLKRGEKCCPGKRNRFGLLLFMC